MSATFALPLGEREVLAALGREAHPLTGDHRDYDALLALVGDARIVLLGEASHGTHEFYRERAKITKHLITEHGFTGVAIEGDWPDAYRVNRYVQGATGDADAEAALGGFRRFPTWMWRNADVLDLVGWLRAHNDGLERNARRIGFYGLDLYSLGASMEAVIGYLDEQDPDAAARARARYECLQPYGAESTEYGRAVLLGVGEPCRRRVVEQLVELRRRAGDYLRRDGLAAEDEYFFAEQNAAVVANAEEYYRTMFGDQAGSWNLRDRHMADTLDQLLAHLDHHPRSTVAKNGGVLGHVPRQRLDRALSLQLLSERERRVQNNHEHHRDPDRLAADQERQPSRQPQQQRQRMSQLTRKLARPLHAATTPQRIRAVLHQPAVRLAPSQAPSRRVQVMQQKRLRLEHLHPTEGTRRTRRRDHWLQATRPASRNNQSLRAERPCAAHPSGNKRSSREAARRLARLLNWNGNINPASGSRRFRIPSGSRTAD